MKLAALSLVAALAAALSPDSMAVPGYGEFATPAGAFERPQPERAYKVVFEVTRGSVDPAKPSVGLERVARFVNMVSAGGVDASQRKLVAVLHGTATEAVLLDEVYSRRHDGARNPNLPLIAALEAAGVEVRVCSHALANLGVASQDVSPLVQIDLAAMLTVAHLQLDGYALVVG